MLYSQAVPVRQFLLTNLNRNGQYPRLRLPVKVIASSLDHMGDFPYKNPEEVCYNGPTLFIRGNRSPYISDDALPVIGRFFPRFLLREVESGHWVISENPAAFLDGKRAQRITGHSTDQYSGGGLFTIRGSRPNLDDLVSCHSDGCQPIART